MSMEFIRKSYNVPAKRGARVEYTGSKFPMIGTIKSADGAHLWILIDGAKTPTRFHPTWKLRYLQYNVAKTVSKNTNPAATSAEGLI